jgi:regulator of replication initiation timing
METLLNLNKQLQELAGDEENIKKQILEQEQQLQEEKLKQQQLNPIAEENDEQAKAAKEKRTQAKQSNPGAQGFDPHFYSPQVHIGRSLQTHGDLFGINPQPVKPFILGVNCRHVICIRSAEALAVGSPRWPT